MNSSLKKIKKETDKKLIEKNFQADHGGRAIISMNVKNDDNFLSKFSTNKSPVIDSSVADFLENSAKNVSLKNGLKLAVSSTCIDDDEKTAYKTAIKEYYVERYSENEKELKRNFAISFILAVIGILILSIAIYLEIKFEALIWSEVIDIVAWVFLWEAVDVLFFRSRELRQKRKLFLSFISMQVEYIEE